MKALITGCIYLLRKVIEISRWLIVRVSQDAKHSLYVGRKPSLRMRQALVLIQAGMTRGQLLLLLLQQSVSAPRTSIQILKRTEQQFDVTVSCMVIACYVS
jgi:hypothetical protein